MFSIKVTCEVTRPLPLVQFERASLSMHAKYEVSIFKGSKVIAGKFIIDNKQTERQTGQEQ